MKEKTELKYALLCMAGSLLFLVWLIPAYTPKSTIPGDIPSDLLPSVMMEIILACGAVMFLRSLLALRREKAGESPGERTGSVQKGANSVAGKTPAEPEPVGRAMPAAAKALAEPEPDGGAMPAAAKAGPEADFAASPMAFWLRFLSVLVLVGLYLFALQALGFYITTLAALPLALWYFNRGMKKWKIFLGCGVLLVFIYILFEKGLSVAMPRGLLF